MMIALRLSTECGRTVRQYEKKNKRTSYYTVTVRERAGVQVFLNFISTENYTIYNETDISLSIVVIKPVVYAR